MTLSPGLRLGPYEVVAPIGAGGMGEVYKARDTRLDRVVALKVLPARFAESAERRIRFEREARAVSALSHPHVCALYDVGEYEGAPYIVLEYLEGTTLAERISRGPLPLGLLLKIGMEVAEGLDAAHRSGFVHRDLKPGNVLLTRSGVKLLDFGLAKAVAPSTSGVAENSSLPTETSAGGLTENGIVMGTAPYISPEQLEGRDADARSDLFALGAVLFEMATGERAFGGKSSATVVAAILSGEPPSVSALRPGTPSSFDRLVGLCLAKNPDDRWQTAHDVKLQLGGIAAGSDASPAVRGPSGRGRAAWGVAAALFVGLLAALFLRSRAGPAAVVRFSVRAPVGSTFNFIGRDAGPFAISPDGRTLALVATAPGGRKLLFVRTLDTLEASALEGTDGAGYPFWSPDSRFIGFFADGRLKKIPATGGVVQTICDAPWARGGAWSRDDVIVFAPGPYDPLSRVSASGGVPSAVTRFDESRPESTHRWPVFLPDGDHFLFLSRGSVAKGTGNSFWLGSLSKGAIRRLRDGNSSLAFVPPGLVLFVDGGNLVAAPFDTKRLEFAGEARPLASKIQLYLNTSSAVFSASANVLAYQADASPAVSQVAWFERSGRTAGPAGPAADYEDPPSRRTAGASRPCGSIRSLGVRAFGYRTPEGATTGVSRPRADSSTRRSGPRTGDGSSMSRTTAARRCSMRATGAGSGPTSSCSS